MPPLKCEAFWFFLFKDTEVGLLLEPETQVKKICAVDCTQFQFTGKIGTKPPLFSFLRSLS